MRNIQILTDSCADLPGELLAKHNIDYCHMNTVRDGVETPASLTWEAFTPHEFYDIVRKERVLTTQVPMEEFNKVFTKYLDAGCDIVYVACSVKQSSSVNTASVVAKKLLENYPDARIACIDSLNASIGEGMIAVRAAELAAEGKDFDTVVELTNKVRNEVNEYLTVHTLEYLRRSGRVKGSAAFFGNLMGVKPIMIADACGVQTPIKKVKGRANSMQEVVNLLKEAIINPENQTVYIAHSDCDEAEIDTLRNMIKAVIPCRDIVVTSIGPIVGASIGPGAIGVWGFGKEVTYSVEAAAAK